MRRLPLAPALLLLVPLLSGCPATPAGGAPATPSATSSVLASLTATGKALSYGDFRDLTARPEAVVIDVRTAKEYGTGHISGARNIDLGDPGFATLVGGLPRDGLYLVYDRTGKRAEQAAATMRQLGFSNVHYLDGGIVAWRFAGQPVVEGQEPGAKGAPLQPTAGGSVPAPAPATNDQRGADGRFHPDETAPAPAPQPSRDDLPAAGR